MAKSKQVYVCSNCGADSPRWMGKCPSCGEWNTLEEKTLLVKETKVSQMLVGDQGLVKLGNVDVTQNKKVTTTFSELDVALGGGLVDGQVVLVSGEPGIGKSTLLLQLAVNISQQGIKCLYVSGEESAQQVSGRAARIYPKGEYKELQFLLTSTVDKVFATLQDNDFDLVIFDSIQTISDDDVVGVPGGMAQVKAVAAKMVSLAKQSDFRLLIVGHINKDGDIAGPKVLEHLVDTVLRFEGERDGLYRVVRAVKNRFGGTGEVGILEMTGVGMRDVDLAQGVFAGGGEGEVGAVKTVAFEGNRPIVVQVQALVGRTVFPYPKRVAEGVPISRLQLICAILERYAKISLTEYDVYVRTAGGYSLESATSDLAVAAAIVSAFHQLPVGPDVLCVGELGLSGRLFLPNMYHDRLKSVSKYGIKRLVSVAGLILKGVKLLPVGYVGEIVSALK